MYILVLHLNTLYQSHYISFTSLNTLYQIHYINYLFIFFIRRYIISTVSEEA